MNIVFWQPYAMEYGSDYLSRAIAGLGGSKAGKCVLLEEAQYLEEDSHSYQLDMAAEPQAGYYSNKKNLRRILEIYKEEGWCPRQSFRDNAVQKGQYCYSMPYYVDAGSREAYEPFGRYYHELISQMSLEYPLIVGDFGRLAEPYTGCFFEMADVIAICLENHQDTLDRLFGSFHSFQHKFFYIVAGCDFHGHLSLQNILYRYRIEENRLGIVKHQRRFFEETQKSEIMCRIREQKNSFSGECSRILQAMMALKKNT